MAGRKENNPRTFLKGRFKKEQHPKGDRDCRLGVKRSHNQEQADGSSKASKECLWGYGSGVIAATTPDYGDVALAEWTQPFNCADVTYYDPLVQQVLDFVPKRFQHLAADAAFDAWYLYQDAAEVGGIAAIPLRNLPQATFPRDCDGVPLCPKGKALASHLSDQPSLWLPCSALWLSFARQERLWTTGL
jgi:hypothetical protein